jgi:chromosome segregation ATPase
MGAMPPFMGDKYDVSDKLLHIEDDINETNQIMGVVNKLNERFKVLEQERKDLAEEVERLRQDNTNLTNEINKIQNDANMNKTNADNELFSLKEMLNSTKNELDYMRSEAEKYRKIQADLLVEIDEREVQYKKQLEDKEREIEMKMIDQQQNEKRRLESEMREATRKLEHYGGENKDLNETIKKLREEIRKLKLKLQEMQSSFRDYLNNQNEDNEDEESGSSAKAKLMKTFTDRENQLMEDLGVQKAENENLREKLKKMRTYARKARNIALDYYPPNEELPEMLTKDLEAFFQDAENESVIQFLEFEIRSLRERNKKLEYENNRLKTEYNINSNIQPPNYGVTNNKLSQTMGNKPYSSVIAPPNVPVNQDINNLSEREIQKKILEEISKLKNTPQGGIVDNNNNNIINSQQIQELNKLRSDNMKLNEENKRLKTIINDNTVNDIQKTNEPDNPKAMKMKINFLEKTIEQLEKERSELNMRCTMAEEQLKNFQEMFNTTTQGYQKKILELNKRLEAANLRLNQEYLNSNMD